MATTTYRYPRKNSILPQLGAVFVGGLTLFLGTVLVWTLGYQLIYAGRIFPGISVAGVDLSGLPPDQAAVKLNQTLSFPLSGKVVFRDGDKVWVASPVQLGMVFDPSASGRAAFDLGRGGGLFGALAGQVQAGGGGAEVPPVVIFDQRLAYQYLQSMATEINRPVVEASLHLEGTNVVATPGRSGRTLNLDATLVYLSGQLQSFRDGEVKLVIQESQPSIMDVSAQAEAARQILSQPLTLVIPNAQAGDAGPWTYAVPVIANLLVVQRVDNGGQAQVQVGLNPNALNDMLTALQPQVDQPPKNARFSFDDATSQLVLLQSSRIGRNLDVGASILLINEALARGEHTVALKVVETQPAVSDTATAAQLGITGLLPNGEYTSYFGFSAARNQNIQTAADRFNGVLVAPGETFSMGQTLGDVSLDNGFAEALIIYGGRTIKGVGGGVCQVSTTLFRTVFFAGFPINERTPHAYRVSYYEQTANGIDPNLAGLDATVYFPLVDFKFTNDTPYWLLMETYTNPDARTLTWKLYSTSDGRSVTYDATGPQSVVQAPDPLFQENPDLNANQMQQTDWAANGADVTVTRTVMRGGQVYFQNTIQTHYQPWQAVCEYGPGTEDPKKMAQRKDLCQPPSY